MRHHRTWTVLALLLAALALAGPGLAQPGPAPSPDGRLFQGQERGLDPRAVEASLEEPIIGPGSWTDTLDDALGLSWLEGTQLGSGQVNLNRMEPLGDDVGAIWALTEGPDGRFYMGTDDASLWSYDPTTGQTANHGYPVPGECSG